MLRDHGVGLVKCLGCDKRKPICGQRPGCFIDCLVFIQEVSVQIIPIARGNHLLFVAEIIQNVGRMRTGLIYSGSPPSCLAEILAT